MLELRGRFRRRGYEGTRYDEIGYAMLDFCLHGGRRGQEIFDQPKAVRPVLVCLSWIYLHGQFPASLSTFLVCTLRRQLG